MTAVDKTMPCAACGAQVPAGSAVCVRCGAAARAPVGAPLRGFVISAPSAPSAPAPVSAPAPRGTGAIAAAATAAAGRAGHLTARQAEVAHTVAEPVGVAESEAARVFADGADHAPMSPRPWIRRRGVVTLVIVLALLGMQAWRCVDERGATTYQTSPNGYDASGSGLGKGSTTDRLELRRLLDELMAVNASLPHTVDEPLPDASQRAIALGREIRKWKRTNEALPGDERLAAVGTRFAFALTEWLDDPSVPGTYEAYDSAWNAWDAADDTWETAAE